MKTPSAAEVRNGDGFVDVGAFRVAYNSLSAQQRMGITWHVRGAEGPDGYRDTLEVFGSFRDAVRYARKLNKEV